MRTFGYTDFWFIVDAAQWTVLLSLMAFVGGGIVGLIIALSRASQSRTALVLSTGFIQLFRGTPLLLQLFLVFFGAPVLGLDVNPWVAAAVALTLKRGAFRSADRRVGQECVSLGRSRWSPS